MNEQKTIKTQKTQTKRASFEELLTFCQKVREAGGGNPLDALMPGIPHDTNQCIIAKNLNFNCDVDLLSDPHYENQWIMFVDEEELALRLADNLGLPIVYSSVLGIVLPEAIGQVADDFDNWTSRINASWDYELDRVKYVVYDKDMEEFNKFLPYVEESYRQNYKYIVNEKGESII